MGTPHISVIIPTLDRPELVVACIGGVVSGEFRDFEIIVVDQSRDARTRSAIQEHFGSDARVRYFHSDVSGAARARNLGSEHARGEFLAFIDDDAIPEKGWLSAYAEAFREITPTPGMIGGRLSPIWEVGCPPWYPRQLLPMLGAYDAGDRIREFPAGDFPISANFALPRSLFETLGGFDTRLGFDTRRKNPLLGGEDSHLGLKVMNSGRSVYYHPGAEVRHLIRASKLTIEYLVRRRFWDGRTYVQLRLRTDGERRSWIQVAGDALAKRRSSGAPHANGPRQGTRAQLMFALGTAAFGVGLLAETVAVRIGAGE